MTQTPAAGTTTPAEMEETCHKMLVDLAASFGITYEQMAADFDACNRSNVVPRDGIEPPTP